MNDDWFDLLAALIDADARFMVVGAHAGLKVPFLGRDSLRQNKLATGRTRIALTPSCLKTSST